ncbi:MAG: OB-fold domain-containing protein [Myxococcota bacterium]
MSDAKPSVIAPTPDGVDQFFWDGVARKRFLLQRCSACGALRQPPAPMCAACNALEWETLEASGRGTVYSWLASQHPTEPEAAPRIIVLLELEEGVRFVSNLVDCPLAEVHFGLPVELTWIEFPSLNQEAPQLLPQFRPAADAA